MASNYKKVPNLPNEGYEDDESFELENFSDLNSLDYDLDHEQVELDESHFRLDEVFADKSSMKMAFMNMANSILGAGAIGTPFAMSNCGIVGGAIALVLLTILVDFTLRLIVINMKLSGKNSYQDTVENCFGRKGKILIIVTQALFAFGGSIGFCIIIGDSIPHILRAFFPGYINHPFWVFIFSRNVIIFLVTVTISYPLSLSRDISKLAKASALALLSMIVIIIIVLVRGPQLDPSARGSFNFSTLFISTSIFQGISVISFALVCHHNTSFIFHSMKDPSLNRFAKVTHASCFVSMVAIALIGFGGFVIFKDKTKGNILNNFPGDDNIVNIARFCFGFNMMTTYPLEIFVLRDVLRDLYYLLKDSPGSPELSRKSHFFLTTVLVAVTMGISLTTCNLGALFELIGATTASIMAYIVPPLCYLQMTKNSKKSLRKKALYYGCVVFGFSVMFISSSQTIVKAIKSPDESHCVV